MRKYLLRQPTHETLNFIHRHVHSDLSFTLSSNFHHVPIPMHIVLFFISCDANRPPSFTIFTLDSVQSDLLKISQCHFNAVSELLLEGAIQTVSPETQPPQPKHKGTVGPLSSQKTSGQMSSETVQQHYYNPSDKWKFR